jgi:hypothetical protein
MDLFRWFAWPFRRDQEAHVSESPDVPAAGGSVARGPRFQGEFTPQNLAFDSNLQEFAQRVAYICGLESAGKITPNDAHAQIRDLYEELARTHRGLGIGETEDG